MYGLGRCFKVVSSARALGRASCLNGLAKERGLGLELCRFRSTTSPVSALLPQLDGFAKRHIGPNESETEEMLACLQLNVSGVGSNWGRNF